MDGGDEMRAWMKRVFLGILSLLPVFAFFACTPAEYLYGKSEYGVQAIQLIHYDETGAEEQNYDFLGLKSEPFHNFALEKCTVLEELSQEVFDEYEEDMCIDQRFWYGNATTKSPYGYGVRIVYGDGTSFVTTWSAYTSDMIYTGFVGVYDANGTPRERGFGGIDPTWYMTVAANYFEMKIPY